MLRGEAGAQSVGSSQLSEGTMMVGAVPCKLSSELHVNGQRVFRAKDKSMEREVVVADAGRSPKRSRVISAEGREVVGPGYSMPTCMHKG
jgi:hypothetical protein